MINKSITILNIIALVLAGFFSLLIVPETGVFMNASAESMVHTTTPDFESGDTNFVDISNGTLMLYRGLHLNFYDGGDSASDLYGNSVSGAGDVNGDGLF